MEEIDSKVLAAPKPSLFSEREVEVTGISVTAAAANADHTSPFSIVSFYGVGRRRLSLLKMALIP